MTDKLTLCKLMVLYLLKRMRTLTNAQISDFMLASGYADYFSLQKEFSELVESGLISQYVHNHSSHFQISEEGEVSLAALSSELTNSAREEMDAYLKENAGKLGREVAATADYYEFADGFKVSLALSELGDEILRLSMSVPSEAAARKVCDNWAELGDEVYEMLLTKLFMGGA